MWRLRVLIPALSSWAGEHTGRPRPSYTSRGDAARLFCAFFRHFSAHFLDQDVKDNLAARPSHAVHTLAGQQLSGAEIIVQVLADEGVETVFGYSGGAILPTYDAIFVYNQEADRNSRAQIPLIVPANEQGAGFMAAGYARASGKVGVCVVTSGPGATNTVTPVRDCTADSVPIVVICGQVPTSAIGCPPVSGIRHSSPGPRRVTSSSPSP